MTMKRLPLTNQNQILSLIFPQTLNDQTHPEIYLAALLPSPSHDTYISNLSNIYLA